MPWKSEAQRRWMWANKPKMARKWSDEYKTPKNLPYHVDDKKDNKEEVNKMAGFDERVLEAIQISGAALEKAETELHEKRASADKYQHRLPSVIEKLAKFGRIDNTPEDRQTIARVLSTPEGALDVIEKLAEYAEDNSPAPIGTPVDSKGRPASTVKKASAKFEGGGRPGARTSEKSAADRQFEMAILGRELSE